MKVMERIEDGTTTYVTMTEGLTEISHAQMEGKRDVRTMSGGGRGWFIEYKDGRKVHFARVDVDDSVMEPRPEPVAAEPVESAKPNLVTHTGTVHAPGRYDKRVRSNVPRCCTSVSAIRRMHYIVDTAAPVTCKRCLAALAKEGA